MKITELKKQKYTIGNIDSIKAIIGMLESDGSLCSSVCISLMQIINLIYDDFEKLDSYRMAIHKKIEKSYYEQYMDFYNELMIKIERTVNRESLENALKALTSLHCKAMEEKNE
jgi:hypothetical protein